MVEANIEVKSGPEENECGVMESMVCRWASSLVITLGRGWNSVTLTYEGGNDQSIESLRIAFEKFLNDQPDHYEMKGTSEFNPRRLKWSDVHFNLSYMTDGLRQLIEQLLAEKRNRHNFTTSNILQESPKRLN